MENEIFIASEASTQIKKLSPSDRERAIQLIDSLNTDWQNSQVIVPDASSSGGGLRAVLSGNIRVFFRSAPEQHAIIVADISSIYDRELSATA
jgi:mRNA-degrading endonuclease RelE of RelBE toxin-antitoxin system